MAETITPGPLSPEERGGEGLVQRSLTRRMEMYRILIAAPLMALLLAACIVTPAHHGSGVVVAPALPVVVEIGVEPYYYQDGYHYYYNNNRWSYSNSRSGPWTDLPRSHYPKEVKHKKDGDHDRGKGKDRDRGKDRDDDRRERD
jgi:hypothetical protein